MNFYIPLFILIPFIGFVISLIPNNHQEKWIYRTVFMTLITHFLLLTFLCVNGIFQDDFNLFFEGPALYKTNTSNFSFHLYFDVQTGFFAWITDFILILVSTFSKTYLHREKGFKRFFNNPLIYLMQILV